MAMATQDATSIHYELGRKANVSIYLQDAAGQRYYFRNTQPRTPGVYDVLFGGVIDGKLLADGDYTWVIEATDEGGQSQSAQGKFAVRDGDKMPPQITKFTISPKEIHAQSRQHLRPVTDQCRLEQTGHAVGDAAKCVVSMARTRRPPIIRRWCARRFRCSEKEGALRKSGEAGLHEFDYDAGVDLGADPPPDGTYVVTARVEDAIGQAATLTDTLTIKDGGIPRAEIVDGTVNFSRSSLLVGDTLYFTLTVENYGAVPIRTSGPEPGYVYNLDQNYNVPGFAEESGAWRVGIDFDTSQRNYPFRWAVGGPGDLITQDHRRQDVLLFAAQHQSARSPAASRSPANRRAIRSISGPG